MENYTNKLHQVLAEIDEDFGGDVTFIPTVSLEMLDAFDSKQKWQLPGILRHMLSFESNGLLIGNKRILSLLDKEQKKTLVDNIERNNDARVSSWFKTRPQIFNDYLVFASDGELCFCYSKKYNSFNPSVYMCSNPNGSKGVDFDKLDMDLPDLIKFMIDKEFS